MSKHSRSWGAIGAKFLLKTVIYCDFLLKCNILSLFITFLTETISRTDEGQSRPKYIFNKCGTDIYFFTLQRIWSNTITEGKKFNLYQK